MCAPDAPDYGPMAAASERAAELGFQLGNRQMDFAERQYNELSPVIHGIADKQGQMMDEQMRQGKDYFDYMKNTFRPLEKGLVSDAEKFSTEAYAEQQASKAAADSARAFDTTRRMNERSMASMGVNPNSGKFAAMNAQSGLQAAGARAGAMTNARAQADAMGWAKRMDAAGLGRGLAGASTGAYSSANAAGNSAAQNYMAPGNQYMSGMAAGSGTIMQGQGLQMQGLSGILNSQTQMAMNGGVLGDIGALVGAGASIYSMSDRRMKENIRLVGHDRRTCLPLYEFSYIGDDTRFIGVMADDVEKTYPDAVKVNDLGFSMVDYGKLGIEMKEVRNGQVG